MRKIRLLYIIAPILLLTIWGCSNTSELEQIFEKSKASIQAKKEGRQVMSTGNQPLSFVQKYLFGTWKVKKIVKYAWIMTISKETATNLVGTELTFGAQSIESSSEEVEPILIEEDKATTPQLANPKYIQTTMSKAEFNDDNEIVQLQELGFKNDSIAIIEIFTDKDYENQWSLGYIYMDPLTPDRLIIATNGAFFEVEKLK